MRNRPKRKLYICHSCNQYSTKEFHEKEPNFCGDCGSDKIMIDCRERRDELLQACYKFIEENELEHYHVEYDGVSRDGYYLLSDICTATLTLEEWDAGYDHD